MKKPFKIVLFGLIALGVLVIGSLLAMQTTTSAFAQAVDTPTPTPAAADVASPAPTTTGSQAGSLVTLWDQFCVAKIPYTLLAVPQGATYNVTQPTGALPTPVPGYTTANQIACDNGGISRGQQLVVCRGPQLYSFGLHVSSSGATEDYQVPMKECALPHTTHAP
jgi:hypothetical protein